MEWTETVGRYGNPRFDRSDGATVTPTLTAAGNLKYEAWHPKRGIACSDRGYTTKFSSAAVAKRWVEKMDVKGMPKS